MRTALSALFLAAVLASPLALAKKPTDFREPTEMTEADYEAAQAAKKGKLVGYNAGIVEEKPREIPWMLIGLFAICVTIATPFAMKMFASTAKDIKTSTGQLKNGMDDSPN